MDAQSQPDEAHDVDTQDDKNPSNQMSPSTQVTRFSAAERFSGSNTTPPNPIYTDGEPRVFMTSDGIKQCLAMLLPDGFANDVDRLIRDRKALEEVEKQVSNAELEAGSIEMRIRNLVEYELAEAESQEERKRVQ